MKTPTLGLLLVCSSGISLAQGEQALCPKHIEIPDYPAIARVARLTGKVSLALTIDADGQVIDVKARTETNIPGESEILAKGAVSNIRKWTFSKPPTAPFTETVVYDYEIDETGQTSGTKVTFDLPLRVTMLADIPHIETSPSNKHR